MSRSHPPCDQHYTRIKYDYSNQQQQDRQNQKLHTYVFDPNYSQSTAPCQPAHLNTNSPTGSLSIDQRVLTESQLRNTNQNLSKDRAVNPSVEQQWNQPYPACPQTSNYTRNNNQLTNLREIGINRFQPICENPQDPSRWDHLNLSHVNMDVRRNSKDNYVPCLPRLGQN